MRRLFLLVTTMCVLNTLSLEAKDNPYQYGLVLQSNNEGQKIAVNQLDQEEIDKMLAANQEKSRKIVQQKSSLKRQLKKLEEEKNRNNELLSEKEGLEETERALLKRKQEIEQQEKKIQETKKKIIDLENAHIVALEQEKIDAKKAQLTRIERKQQFQKNLEEEALLEQERRRQAQESREEELKRIKKDYELSTTNKTGKAKRPRIPNTDPIHHVYKDPFPVSKRYLVVYSNKVNTTVPVLTMPRFPLQYKIGFTYYTSAPRQVFTTTYWLDDPDRSVNIEFESNYLLVCIDDNLQAHYYNNGLTNRNHLCYLDKESVNLDEDNNYRESFKILAKYRVKQVLFLHKKDQNAIGVRNPRGYNFLYYNIYTTEFGSKPRINIRPVYIS